MKLIVLFGYLATIASSQRTCGENEEFNRCGPACPAVCGDSGPKICTLQCVKGCFCKSGFVLDKVDGQCISINECPTEGVEWFATDLDDLCGLNEVFTACNGHCRPTCETGTDIACTMQCQLGCNCKDGYILNESGGECIPINDCPTDEPLSAEVTVSTEICPFRCKAGYDGCNTCGCDGMGDTTICTKAACKLNEFGPTQCTSCEIGYTLNEGTNQCQFAKIECMDNEDCDRANGFICGEDPECEQYSDVPCKGPGPNVCIASGPAKECEFDIDCKGDWQCLNGDAAVGKCVKYQSPPSGSDVTLPPVSDVCPFRCLVGYDGCNTCRCDGMGNIAICTQMPCIIGQSVTTQCRQCQIGYTYNPSSNTCDSVKVSCSSTLDCDTSGFRTNEQIYKCRKDPECRAYSDMLCEDTDKVCVSFGLNRDTFSQMNCTTDADCVNKLDKDELRCLEGDTGKGKCVKYQLPN